jgi:hypothetical protein
MEKNYYYLITKKCNEILLYKTENLWYNKIEYTLKVGNCTLLGYIRYIILILKIFVRYFRRS